MKPLISVIVPIYEIDKYIGLCIESIIKQTYRNLEIILVDDGSKDRSSEICDLYAEKDRRIKVIHKENSGLVSARKAGILASSGEYTGYVDGDDWIEEDFYQALIDALEENDSDVAVAGFSRDLFSKSQKIHNSIAPGLYAGDNLKDFYSHMILNGLFFRHGITTYSWNKLFRRDLFTGRQLEVDDNITIGEDAAAVYSFLTDCRRICVTDNCSYHYRQREDSMLKTQINFERETFRLKLLHEHLVRTLSDCDERYNLMEQSEEFITSVYMTRSGLKYFPLNEKINGKRILLYGAGTFGKQLERRLREEKICEIAGWIDEDYWEYRRCCINVDPVERAAENDYDYVLIMNLNPYYSEKVRRELIVSGVQDKKIMTIKTDRTTRYSALQEYLTHSYGHE